MANKELQPDDPRAQIPDASVRGVRLVALVGVILGFCGLVSLPFGFYQLASWLDIHPGRRWSPSTIVASVAILAGFGLSLLVVIGGVGSWNLRFWARPLMVLYGAVSVLSGLGLGLIALIWFFTGREDLASLRNVTTCCLLVAWPLGMVYGGWVLYFMLRPDVRALFASGPPDETQ